MPATPSEAIAKGVDYLLATQDASGGWLRSRYGALRGGAALTAFVLRVLAELAKPKDPPPPARPSLAIPAATARPQSPLAVVLREPVAAAVRFLRPGLERRGAICCPDGTLDLPVYATALALLAESPDQPLWSAVERQRMRDYLFATQVSTGRGFAASDIHRGGWDLGSMPPPRGITTGTNLSLTAWALQALAHSAPKAPADRSESSTPPVATGDMDWRETARRWLERCQNRPGDGGFVFTPDRGATDNKAGLDPATRQPFSYGSASCDGLLALASLRTLTGTAGANAAASFDAAWNAALGWFAKLERWDIAAGGTDALRFYWAARLVEASAFFPPERKAAARESLAAAVIARQRADGSWANPEPAMREDDPLIATPLAIAALGGVN
jgi:hypothetical protein